jgi:hypothetical protein
MNNSSRFTIYTLFVMCIFFCCSCSNKTVPKKPVPANTEDTVYVGFTKALRQRIANSNIDIKKVQFFVDQKLILRRTLGNEKAEVQSGVILFEKGAYINEIIIPAFTPGICEFVNGDRLKISFEKQGNYIEFAALNDVYYKLTGTNWDTNNGTTDITYDGYTYKVQCATCSSAGEAKLVVIKKEIDNLQSNQRVVEGRKVGN